jgi:GNAT superfamily N-acetyltransferase
MKKDLGLIRIRPFEPGDADSCFRIRAEAFVRVFYDEIGAEEASAGLNAYMPADYVRMAEAMDWFVAQDTVEPVGFSAIRNLDEATAELLFLYVRLSHTGRGIGTRLLRFTEERLREAHPEVSTLVLDTIVPGYNRGFYERMGFSATGEGLCEYPGAKIRCVRLAKGLNL